MLNFITQTFGPFARRMARTRTIVTAMLLLCYGAVCAQSISVTGEVVDEDNEPLPGATVRVEGTNAVTATDSNGEFTISAKKGDKLSILYVGFYTETVTVEGSKKITVNMRQKLNEIDEVVVIGYGTQRKSDISTAIASVNMEDIAKSGSSQAIQALQGKVSGLQVMPVDGSLAGGVSFRMRGVNSVTGGTQPLFVIDGVAMPVSEPGSSDIANNPLMGLNPSDIASIEVLKDAAAAAIYGAKGSNGVVLITTRRGEKSAKPKFNISVNGGIDFKPDINLKVLSPEEYAYKMLDKGTYDSPNLIDFWTGVINKQGWNDPNVHNWIDEIMRTAYKYEVNAAMSGDTGGTNYMVSASYMNTTGVIKRSRFDRFTSRVNLQQKVSNTVNVGVNLSYSTSSDHNPTTDWSQSGIILNALQRSPFLFYPGFSDIMNYSNVSIMSPLVAVEQVDSRPRVSHTASSS